MWNTYLELIHQYRFGEEFGFSSPSEEARLKQKITELWQQIK